MNYFKSCLPFLVSCLIGIVFFHGHLSAQNIFIDEICACEENSEIRSFTITFGQWPAHIDSSYNVNITYTKEGGGRDTMSAENVAGDPNRRMTLVFSGLSNAANPGDLQIFRVVNASSNLPQPVSAAFIPYLPAPDVEVIPPADTTINTCQLSGLSIEEAFDAWLSGAASANGCGDIELTNDWDGIYPSCQDSLSISFTATDQNCANLASSSSSFSIEDCQPPTPVVVNGVVSAQVSANDCVEVHINEFDAGSFDDCGEPTLSYSSDPSDTIRTFCCQIMEDIREVEFWVTDDAGNQDFLETYVRIEGCDSPPRKIMGRITTSDGDGVQGVQVFLEDTSSSPAINSMTGSDGNYTFHDVEEAAVYTISAFKNDDILNGVNTLDILYIQQHILGLNPIVDPYRLIAANVYEDQRISGADMIEIRRAILGIQNEFTNNTSWRFVDAKTLYSDGQLPLNYPEEIQVFNPFNQNFIAVKIGDINGTAKANITDTVEAEGNQEPLELTALDLMSEKGERVEMEVRSSNFNNVQGVQFTLEYDRDAMECLEIKGEALDLNENNYKIFSEKGLITFSWNGKRPFNLDDHETLFTIKFKAGKMHSLRELVRLNGAITPAEAFINYQSRKLSLRFLENPAFFALEQNVPNPFDTKTIIQFNLPERGAATLNFFDAQGKLVFTIRGEYAAGRNQVRIDRADFPIQGLYYYELLSGGHRAAKKMVIAGK